MVDVRRPLGPTHDNPSASADSDAESSSSHKLYPIFLSRSHAGIDHRRPAKQRRTKSMVVDDGKVSTKVFDEDLPRDTDRLGCNRLPTYFAPSTPLRVGGGSCARPAKAEAILSQSSTHSWRRSRKRLGLGSRTCPAEGKSSNLATLTEPDPFLKTLVTRISPDPRLPPSTLFLPSLNSPTGQDRDHDPALVVAFNMKAKLLTASDASLSGEKRLLAIGGEEGAIKIIDVDALQEHDSKWWTAHQNGIFDLSWCDDDRHIVSDARWDSC